MKTLKFIFLFFNFFLLNLNAQITYNVSIQKSNLTYETKLSKDGEIYQTLTLKNLGYIEKVGAPNLPVKFVKLIIPAQQDVDVVNFTYKINKKKLY